MSRPSGSRIGKIVLREAFMAALELVVATIQLGQAVRARMRRLGSTVSAFRNRVRG